MAMNEATRERFEHEQTAYWRQRDELLQCYRGKWVAIVDGQVTAIGEQMNRVAAEAFRKSGSGLMYVNLVGGKMLSCVFVRLPQDGSIRTMCHLYQQLPHPLVICE